MVDRRDVSADHHSVGDRCHHLRDGNNRASEFNGGRCAGGFTCHAELLRQCGVPGGARLIAARRCRRNVRRQCVFHDVVLADREHAPGVTEDSVGGATHADTFHIKELSVRGHRLLLSRLAITWLAVTCLAVTGLAVTGLAVTGLAVTWLAVAGLAHRGSWNFLLGNTFRPDQLLSRLHAGVDHRVQSNYLATLCASCARLRRGCTGATYSQWEKEAGGEGKCDGSRIKSHRNKVNPGAPIS